MKKVTKLWTTREGNKIRICDMEDTHLKNAIKMLERKAVNELRNMPYPDFNGEMAQDLAEHEYLNLMEKDAQELAEEFYPIYESLINERERRFEIKLRATYSMKG